MAAPIGNKNAKGKHRAGAGRKSLRAELSDWEELRSLWEDPLYSKEEVRKILSDQRSKLSAKELIKIKLSLGNGKLLAAVFSKRFPDKIISNNYEEKEKKMVIWDM